MIKAVLKAVLEAVLKVVFEVGNMPRADRAVMIHIGTTIMVAPEAVYEEIMVGRVDKAMGACREEEEVMEEDLVPMVRDKEELGEDQEELHGE